ncbi:MAG: type II secretion system protein N [Novosphingobium sp.]
MNRRWIFLREGPLSRRGKWAVVGLTVLALLILFPLRLALAMAAPPALTGSEVAGAVWNGRIADLRVGSLPLGTVQAGLRPLPLLIGRAELAIARPGPAGTPDLSGVVGGGAGGTRLSRVNGQLALGEGFADLPAASMAFRDFHLALAGGRCREAGGEVSLVLAPVSPLMPAPLALSGKARCAGPAVYVPMTGPTGMERLFLRIEPDGRWRAELVLAGLPAEVAAPLLEMGFAARPGGIGVTASGRM